MGGCSSIRTLKKKDTDMQKQKDYKVTENFKDRLNYFIETGKIRQIVCETVDGEIVRNSKRLFSVMRLYTSPEPDVEQVVMFFLSVKNRILATETVATGSITSSSIYPREVVKRILQHKAAAIIMCHNHPSGDPRPSSEDIQMTVAMVDLCHTIGVAFHEHLISGGDTYFSFCDTGILGTIRRGIDAKVDGISRQVLAKFMEEGKMAD